MSRKNTRLRLCLIWIGLNLAFIWGNSMLPGHISGAISDWVKSLVAWFFPEGLPGMAGGGMLRKIAHFLEFCSLGAAFSWLWRIFGRNGLLSALFALACGCAAACLDETIQLFVPGRYGCLRDVCIDTAGVLTGIAVFAAGYAVWCKKRHLKETQ